MRIGLIVFLVIIVALAITNPGPERYESFVEDTVVQVIRQQAGDAPWGTIVGGLGGALARQLARTHTERDNYVVLSVYTLDMELVGLPNERWRFLGIAGTFIELERPHSLRE